VYFNHKHKIVIQHVPKTGGTSLLYSLRKNNRPDSEWLSPFGMHITYTILERRDYQLYEDVKDNWLKMSTVRNPWDHAVSRYFHFIDDKRIHKSNKKGHPIEKYSSFEFYLNERYDHQDIFTFDCKNFMVDQWIKYETLEDDWLKIVKKLDFKHTELVSHNITKKRTNYFNYSKPDDYREMYINDDMIGLVMKKSQKTIELFGYSF